MSADHVDIALSSLKWSVVTTTVAVIGLSLLMQMAYPQSSRLELATYSSAVGVFLLVYLFGCIFLISSQKAPKKQTNAVVVAHIDAAKIDPTVADMVATAKVDPRVAAVVATARSDPKVEDLVAVAKADPKVAALVAAKDPRVAAAIVAAKADPSVAAKVEEIKVSDPSVAAVVHATKK